MRQLVLRIFIQMANIPLDENLASVLVAAQYVLGYRYILTKLGCQYYNLSL